MEQNTWDWLWWLALYFYAGWSVNEAENFHLPSGHKTGWYHLLANLVLWPFLVPCVLGTRGGDE